MRNKTFWREIINEHDPGFVPNQSTDSFEKPNL